MVRDELIQSLAALFKQETWTMFISSHDIDDVERLADWVGILDRGKLCLSEPIDSLLGRFAFSRRPARTCGPPTSIQRNHRMVVLSACMYLALDTAQLSRLI